MPELPMEYIMTLVTGLLGFGGLRAYEKVKGVATNDYSATPKPKAETTKAEVTLESGDKISVQTTPPPVPETVSYPSVAKRKWSL